MIRVKTFSAESTHAATATVFLYTYFINKSSKVVAAAVQKNSEQREDRPKWNSA
jgi:hypothetical protein